MSERPCPMCDGTGEVDERIVWDEVCPRCQGTGKEPEEEAKTRL